MNIAIIGCGYIGSSVAEHFSKLGHHVTTTTRSTKRLDRLKDISHKSLILHGKDENEIELLIQENDVLILTVAADSPDQYEDAYLTTAQSIRYAATASHYPKTLIYTSSSSVYGDHHGRWVDEQSELLNKSEEGQILIDTEKTLLSLKEFGWNVCIFRLSEIYGPGRDLLSRFKNIEGRKLPGKGQNYTNMVHKEDIVGGVIYALNHRLEGIFNLTDDDHPKRMEFYDMIAQEHNLPKVEWDPSLLQLHSGNKRISNHKMKASGYFFTKPHSVIVPLES